MRARIEVGSHERLRVSTIALTAQPDQQVVWTVDDAGTVHMMPVETGDVYGENTAILRGVRHGTLVVTDHLQSMRQNLKDNVRMRGEISSIEGEARH